MSHSHVIDILTEDNKVSFFHMDSHKGQYYIFPPSRRYLSRWRRYAGCQSFEPGAKRPKPGQSGGPKCEPYIINRFRYVIIYNNYIHTYGRKTEQDKTVCLHYLKKVCVLFCKTCILSLIHWSCRFGRHGGSVAKKSDCECKVLSSTPY